MPKTTDGLFIDGEKVVASYQIKRRRYFFTPSGVYREIRKRGNPNVTGVVAVDVAVKQKSLDGTSVGGEE